MASISKLTLTSAALTAVTTDSDAKSLQNKCQKFIAWVNVTVCDAATTVSAKLQHSPDKLIWVDVVSFTNIVGTTGSEAKHEASFTGVGALFPNIRAVTTLAGATKAATVEVSLWFDDNR